MSQNNKTRFFNNYFLELSIIFIAFLHQILQKVLNINIQFWDFYGDDLFAVPFVSSVVLIIENTFFYKNPDRKHSPSQLVFILVVIILLFEFILPQRSSEYVQDYADIIFYITGTIVYHIIKRGRKKLQPPI